MSRIVLLVAGLVAAASAGLLLARTGSLTARERGLLAAAASAGAAGLGLLAWGQWPLVGALVVLAAVGLGAVGAYGLGREGPSHDDALSRGSLRDRERRLRRIIDHAWGMFLLLDRTGRIEFASDAVTRVMGLERSAAVGEPLRSLVDDSEADAVEEALADAAARPGQRIGVEFKARHRDGTPRWLEGTVTDLMGDADIGSVLVNLHDVTERAKAEEALRESEVQYRGLVDHATSGIYRSDPHGRFIAVNPALVRMLGYESEAELLSVDVATEVYVDPTQRQALIRQFSGASEIRGVEAEWRRKDGTKVLMWLSGRPIRNDDDELVAFEMVAEDVSERRSLEAQLRQAQKMEAIGQLAGGIAHDFNNMLTVILANTDIIESALPDGGSRLRDELTDLRRAAQQGRDLVKKLLGFGRRDMLEVRPVNLARTVEDLLPMLKRVLPENIDVRFNARVSHPVVSADVGSIQQILFNLATNARDAMPKGGTIRLEVGGVRSATHPALERWGARGEFVRLAMLDSGHGMDEDTRARVFDPFFTTKPPGSGTGLGMSMIYGLVKQQNGYILVDSTVGKGTAVELFFPFVAAAAPAAVAGAAALGLQSGSETILVVEDEGAIRRSVKRLLERMGYRVLLANDGAEALDVFRQGSDAIDLVVSDVVMPRMGGFELFDALRSGGNDVPFLFVSGYATPEIAQRTRDEAQVFLQKPWDVEDFLSEIRELLDATPDKASGEETRGGLVPS